MLRERSLRQHSSIFYSRFSFEDAQLNVLFIHRSRRFIRFQFRFYRPENGVWPHQRREQHLSRDSSLPEDCLLFNCSGCIRLDVRSCAGLLVCCVPSYLLWCSRVFLIWLRLRNVFFVSVQAVSCRLRRPLVCCFCSCGRELSVRRLSAPCVIVSVCMHVLYGFGTSSSSFGVFGIRMLSVFAVVLVVAVTHPSILFISHWITCIFWSCCLLIENKLSKRIVCAAEVIGDCGANPSLTVSPLSPDGDLPSGESCTYFVNNSYSLRVC